ncbi:replication restart DNA helicase PriA [Muriicola jejuensis]|uniref:Replication restart protein PriA n=1 Tax=Muriicola jejuensis TaxID=504488 RepID=A0A6P0UCL4_9FLAO|nr:primosomal protein N' [Muriicola jejuensis]NER11005.1 primosomal protein N' [Muriicola jejuensis]SMP14797.1 replication restart DNA helicase PriA [Muriicola jejuensis]
MEQFVDVVLPIPLERLFTYRLPGDLAANLKQGMRVAVPFGKSKIYTALVFRVHQEPPTAYDPKEIHEVIDEVPLVNNIQMEHWQWIATYYMCTLGEVFRTAVPGAFLLESETLVLKGEEKEWEDEEVSDQEFLVLEALEHQTSLKIGDVCDILERKTVLPLLHRMYEKGWIQLRETLHSQYKPKYIRSVTLHPKYESEKDLNDLLDELNRAPKQREVILTLFQHQATERIPIEIIELQKKSRVSAGVIRGLLDKDILQEKKIRTDRITYEGDEGVLTQPELSDFQQKCLGEIRDSFRELDVTLLQGVTSSGKTEVYMKLMETFLSQGKQVLYLLPEIALTTQLISRLQACFGSRVSVFHSRFSLNERVEVWNNVRRNEEKAQVVIGARSSLFLPFENLGLVIVDEEHENSFKQFDPAPRYHARDAAIVLATLHGAKVLLGSATPSLESYYNVRTGKYGHTVMNYRYGGVQMPAVELVDIRDASRRKRMKGHFSEKLIAGIQETLSLREQVILFQNRRGYAPIVECMTCGHAPQCPNCDVSLTYHQSRNELRCHYCGYHEKMMVQCMACGNATLDTKGFGTEQIEKELKELFPEARTGRMDLDTTRGKFAYEKIISGFASGQFDILVGTQMVTKGLDFRHVNLVGIMNADALLNFPDFRAHERSYQLLTQVAGRAGRTEKQGTVLIQTYNPQNPVLRQVVSGDYIGMYEEQLSQRSEYRYPPVNRIIRISFKHKGYSTLNEAAAWFGKALRNAFGEQVLGPEFPPVARIRNQFIKQVLVKIPRDRSLAQTKNSIKRIENSFNAISQYRSVRVIYDVDYF